MLSARQTKSEDDKMYGSEVCDELINLDKNPRKGPSLSVGDLSFFLSSLAQTPLVTGIHATSKIAYFGSCRQEVRREKGPRSFLFVCAAYHHPMRFLRRGKSNDCSDTRKKMTKLSFRRHESKRRAGTRMVIHEPDKLEDYFE